MNNGNKESSLPGGEERDRKEEISGNKPSITDLLREREDEYYDSDEEE